ncbi:MAG: SET domain-containing protein [Chitinophagaceae bacterium]|nr:SET domain-containing protein [Chitinophagaceae bacterium]
MTKDELLNELQNHTWIAIRPSPVEGIGVFALRDIPAGTRGLFSKGVGEWIPVSKKEVAALPDHARALIENYCLYDEENYFIADYGFKVMDLVNYLNHSDTPNLISIRDGEDFETTRLIHSGEELFIDYGSIVDSQE